MNHDLDGEIGRQVYNSFQGHMSYEIKRIFLVGVWLNTFMFVIVVEYVILHLQLM